MEMMVGMDTVAGIAVVVETATVVGTTMVVGTRRDVVKTDVEMIVDGMMDDWWGETIETGRDYGGGKRRR
jgi:hypothetical protein